MAIDPYFLPHLQDLNRQAQKQYCTTGSAFLTLEEAAFATNFFQGKANFKVDGGYEEAERQRLFFAPEGEEIISDLVLLKISPKGKRFEMALAHRDTLGAIMGLGIRRDCIGDLVIFEGEAYLFALPSLKDDLLSLSEVGRQAVTVEEIPLSSFAFAPKIEEKRITLSSLRLDLVVSAAFSLSRDSAKRAVASGLVTLNGVIVQKPDLELQEGDRFSLKSKGKRKVLSLEGESKKGKEVVILGYYR